MQPVVVTLIGTNVKIAWSPNIESNGSPIRAYKVDIRTSDPLVYAQSVLCDG